jgi:hypothetical protein
MVGAFIMPKRGVRMYKNEYVKVDWEELSRIQKESGYKYTQTKRHLNKIDSSSIDLNIPKEGE